MDYDYDYGLHDIFDEYARRSRSRTRHKTAQRTRSLPCCEFVSGYIKHSE